MTQQLAITVTQSVETHVLVPATSRVLFVQFQMQVKDICQQGREALEDPREWKLLSYLSFFELTVKTGRLFAPPIRNIPRVQFSIESSFLGKFFEGFQLFLLSG